MSYLGNEPILGPNARDKFAGTGVQVAYTLSRVPSQADGILVAISGVLQDSSTYNVAAKILTFTEAPPTPLTGVATNIEVIFLGRQGAPFTANWSIPIVTGGGTADAITAAYNPAIASLTNNLLLKVVITGTNALAAPTFNPNGLGVKTIVNFDNSPLLVGQLTGTLELRYDLSADNFKVISSAASVPIPQGQCRLSKSGLNLLLLPMNGSQITIAGINQTIPDAGVTLAPTSLIANTSYFIYAYMVGTVITLEASVTGHSPSTTVGNKGVEIKTADNTRTLVGMARIITGIAWQDTPAQRFVRSWFNRVTVACQSTYTAIRSTSSSTPVELSAEIRNEFLIFTDEVATFTTLGTNNISSSADVAYYGIAFDGVTIEPAYLGTSTASYSATATVVIKPGLSEGYHYATFVTYSSSGAATITYGNNTFFLRLLGSIR